MVHFTTVTITGIIQGEKSQLFEALKSGLPHPRFTLHRHRLIFRRLRLTYLHVTSYFHEDWFYQQNNLVDWPRGCKSERASGAEYSVDYRNEEEAYVRFRKLRDLEEREKRERRQGEDEEEGEYLELDDIEEEELDDGVYSLREEETVTQSKNTVRAVLQQWEKAYHHVTQKRRRAVVALVEPSYDFILSNPDAFALGKEAAELLFMDKFLETMLKKASQDATLASLSFLMIALATLMRVSEVAATSYRSIVFSEKGVVFSLDRLRKAQRCVLALKEILDRTSQFRCEADEGKLIVALIAPHRPVSASTVSRWVISFLQKAGVNTQCFGAHSTRGAAPSKAVSAGIPVEAILRAETCTYCLRGFYHLCLGIYYMSFTIRKVMSLIDLNRKIRWVFACLGVDKVSQRFLASIDRLELHFNEFPILTKKDFLSLCSTAGTITLTVTILEGHERHDNYGSLPDFTNESDSELSMSGTGVDISLKKWHGQAKKARQKGKPERQGKASTEFDMAAQSIVAHFPMAMDASSTDDNIIYSSWYAVNSNVGILSFTSVIADQTIRITVPLYGATIKDSANDRTLVKFSLPILFPPRPSRSSKGSSLPTVKNTFQTLVHRFPDGTNLSEALQQCDRRYIKAVLIPIKTNTPSAAE
ncbi:Uncharacterized protein APZ42_034530 [Daphnia magna]|uniref:Tyr recombinase domain-containing protein n=1 Tax=Daphnia magna TaxID=35525 RepID=A0A164K266_9CRUS|nr:Uncharacterized protein APZ42_034530 [Daphnia magna]